MTPSGIAVRGLNSRRARSIVLCASVALCSLILTAVFSFNAHLATVMDTFGGPRLVVAQAFFGSGSSGFKEMLPVAHLRALEKIPGITLKSWQRSARADDKKGYVFSVTGISEGWLDDISKAWVSVPADQKARFDAEPSGAILSPIALDRLGWKVGDSQFLNVLGRNPIPVKVVGTYTGSSYKEMYVHLKYLDAAQPPQLQGLVNVIQVECKKEECLAKAKEIDDHFANSPAPTLTVMGESVGASMMRAASAIPNLISRIGVLVFIVTTLIAATTFAVSVRERRSEFGTLRAIGFQRRLVARFMFTEATILCGAAGFIGGFVPYVLLLGRALDLGVTLKLPISPDAAILGFVAAVLLGWIAVIPTALMETRVSVVEALES